MTTNARYAVFLNPDTEILEGTFEELVARMDASPRLGLAGVKQITPDGRALPDDPALPERAARVLGGAGLGAASRFARRGSESASSI